MLSFTLLGSVALFKNGQPVSPFRSQKEAALLIYLAQTGRPHSREFIAELLWEGRSTKQALSNLRTVLARLRKQVDDELVVSRQSLTLAPESQQQVDSVILLTTLTKVGRVDSVAEASTLQTALDAYRGDFLADFFLADAPQFDQWVTTTREQIRRHVIAAYDKLGEYMLSTGATEKGIATVRRWLDVDALDETAHTLLIRLLLEDGQRHAALAHYDDCADLLRRELDIAPPAAMTALIQNIEPTTLVTQQQLMIGQQPARQQSTLQQPTFQQPVVQQPILQQRADRPRHNLPAPHDQFFGRIAAQQDINERLDQPWCRLVTIVGQGGVGKTRLATTIARSRLHHYPDGVWLVELAEVDQDDDDLAEAIAVEIATVLDLRLSGSATPVEQLLDHLQHKQLLLVLDNFEHLVEGGMQLVLDLLQHCESIQLLITSREALRTRAEWTVTLTGLDYPTDNQDLAQSDAVDLFAARRAQGQRETMSLDDIVLVRQICRMVEGLPLAIELAAALTHSVSLHTIANELRNGFDTLTTALRDVPDRHRSLQIVFAMSWRTLTKPLQARLARLSVFRGGFTAAAAEQITDTDTQQLIALDEKSLLSQNAEMRRYTLHPVVRAYAAARLVSPDQPLQNHAHYYLTLLAQQRETLQKDTPQHAVTMLEPELENVRLAWQTGLAFPSASSGNGSLAELVEDALTPLSIVYQLRGLAHEAEATMQNTLNAATAWGAEGTALMTRAGLERARFQIRLGRYRPAIETVEIALRHAQESEDRWAEGMGHVLWGEALWRLGEYDASQTKLTHALQIAATVDGHRDGTLLVGWCHHHLGVINDIQSHYATAHEHLQHACSAWRAIDNAQALSGSLNSIGLVYYHQGDLPAAQQAMAEALILCNQLDNRHAQSALLNNLSMIATEQSDYLSAHHYLQLGLEVATMSGNLTSQGEIYSNLGKNYNLLGKTELAVENLEEGLQISESIGNRALMATLMLYLATTESGRENLKRADSLYRQALTITRQDKLQHIECEVLIGIAELLSKENESEAIQYSAQAITLATALRNPDLLVRANAINQHSSIMETPKTKLSLTTWSS